jgi:hypothetical protein
MVRRSCRGLVGGLALRKARNLAQGGGSGDGVASELVGNTLKAIGRRQFIRESGWEDDAGNVTSGGPGEPGTRRGIENLKEEETEEGSDRGAG